MYIVRRATHWVEPQPEKEKNNNIVMRGAVLRTPVIFMCVCLCNTEAETIKRKLIYCFDFVLIIR